MKIKLTKKQNIIIIAITTLLLIIGLCCLLKKPNKSIPNKPIPNKPIPYNNTQTYEQALQNWKNQCYFKQGHQYNSEYIREKLGRSNRKVYCLNSNNIIDIVPSLGTINGINFISAYWFYDYTLDYKYITGYISDDWYFTQPGKEPAYIPSFNALSKDVLGLGTSARMGQIFFDTYVDTTPPPNPKDYGL